MKASKRSIWRRALARSGASAEWRWVKMPWRRRPDRVAAWMGGHQGGVGRGGRGRGGRGRGPQGQAGAAHAGVDFELEGDGRVGGRGRGGAGGREVAQGGQAFEVGDGGDEAGLDGAGEGLGGDGRADHDRVAHAEPPQFEALFDRGDAVAEGAGRAKGVDDAADAEAVPVGLHHGDEPDVRSGRRADAAEVVAQGGRADFHPRAVAGGVEGGRGRGVVGHATNMARMGGAGPGWSGACIITEHLPN